MLNCKTMAKKASEYIDRDLSFMARLNFTLHLILCVHCRKYISQMRTTIKTLNIRHREEDEKISDTDVGKIVELIKTELPK